MYNKKALIYIKHAISNTLDHLPSLTKNDLLQDNAHLLYSLLSINADVTLGKIIDERLLKDYDIVMHINLFGVYQRFSMVDKYDTSDLVFGYLNSNKEDEIVELDSEEEELFSTFRRLMIYDSRSDLTLIKTLLDTYKRMLKTDREVVLYELRHLINIKNKYPDFSINYSIEGKSKYTANYRSINIRENIDSVINHEMGHLFHDLLTNKRVDDDFFEIVDRIVSDSSTLDKVQEFSKIYHKRMKSVKEKYISELMRFEESEDEINRIRSYLRMTKDQLMKFYLSKGYFKHSIERILDNNFTFQEFINQKRSIEREMLYYSITKNEQPEIGAISDIIDALYGGKLFEGSLRDSKSVPIKRCGGHGVRYYSRDKRFAFDEMIAEYITIYKSKNKVEALKILRYIVGDELVDYLDNFYKKEMLESKECNLEINGGISK